MSTEELLRKRVIVENKWPGCGFEPGTILYWTDDKIGGEMYVDDLNIGYPSFLTKTEVEPYPYLLRPLPWWAERKPEDMPEYVKSGGEVFKAYKWFDEDVQVEPNADKPKRFMAFGAIPIDTCRPATLAEYTEYLNTKQ